MEFSSKLIEEAVTEIAKLPGIGKKTALRLAFHLLKQDETKTIQLANALIKLRKDIQYCQKCHFIADTPLCNFCTNPLRDQTTLCIVENSQDIIAIENTAQYKGLYHILGGVISPMEGISPTQLRIDSLLQRVEELAIKEIIFALSPTMEGDTTIFYIAKKLKNFSIKITTIARGIPIGSEIEYTDELTLGKSILSRTQYE
ncbi:MAG: recombination protein RecR [Cytophagales bacterium]|nr:MAG: recombination protein RecR [Cytophagales bacterium]